MPKDVELFRGFETVLSPLSALPDQSSHQGLLAPNGSLPPTAVGLPLAAPAALNAAVKLLQPARRAAPSASGMDVLHQVSRLALQNTAKDLHAAFREAFDQEGRLNLNAVDASAGPVPASEILERAGIQAVHHTPGSRLCIVSAQCEYEGKAVVPLAEDRPNLLTQKDAAGPVTFTLRFPRLVRALEFVRPALFAATGSGVSHARWSAYALDQQGNRLGMIGEELIRHFDRRRLYPAWTFRLMADDPEQGFIAVRVNSDGNLYGLGQDGAPTTVYFAGFSGVLMGDILIHYLR